MVVNPTFALAGANEVRMKFGRRGRRPSRMRVCSLPWCRVSTVWTRLVGVEMLILILGYTVAVALERDSPGGLWVWDVDSCWYVEGRTGTEEQR